MLAPEGRDVLIGHDRFGGAGGGWVGSLPRFAYLASGQGRGRIVLTV